MFMIVKANFKHTDTHTNIGVIYAGDIFAITNFVPTTFDNKQHQLIDQNVSEVINLPLPSIKNASFSTEC